MNNHPVISKPHLQVSVPVTTNGILLKYDGNGQPSFKTKYLPLSAERRLVQRNKRLPEHLRLKIQKVDPAQVAAPVQQVVESEVKNKGGRPKRVQTLDNE